MKETYKQWIEDYLSRNNGSGYGKCKQASEEMVKEFPELKMVCGHVYTDWGKRSHWWTVDADGSIVDPTVSQFDFVYEYEPWNPGQEVRVGKCMNCGDEIWKKVDSLENIHRESICSSECNDAMIEYLDGSGP